MQIKYQLIFTVTFVSQWYLSICLMFKKIFDHLQNNLNNISECL